MGGQDGGQVDNERGIKVNIQTSGYCTKLRVFIYGVMVIALVGENQSAIGVRMGINKVRVRNIIRRNIHEWRADGGNDYWNPEQAGNLSVMVCGCYRM